MSAVPIVQLKQHPFEAEVDKIVQDLGGDLLKMKSILDSGSQYNFLFSDIPCYVGLPIYVPTRTNNVMRMEFIVGEVDANGVGQILFGVTLDMDKERNCPLRVVPRTKNEKRYQIILQAVVDVDQVQPGFTASTILLGAELACFYREEFLNVYKAA